MKKSERIYQMGQLISRKNIKEFYEELGSIIQNFNLPVNQPISQQQLTDYLYLRYLVASAPMVDANNDENITWLMDNNHPDLRLKVHILDLLSPNIFDQRNFKEHYSIQKSEAIDLFNDTQTLILRQFKDKFNPNIESWREEKNMYYEKNSNLFPDRDSTFKYFNMISVNILRNKIMESNIENMERYYVDELIKFYPKGGSKAVELMQRAGYEKKEMPALIDRTAGRQEKTKYLYNILPKGNR